MSEYHHRKIAIFTIFLGVFNIAEAIYLYYHPDTTASSIAISSVFFGIFYLFIGYQGLTAEKLARKVAKNLNIRRRI